MDGSLPPPFSALLRRHRLAASLSQEELAERASLSARSVSDLERGVSTLPRPTTVRLLADALNLSRSDRTAFFTAAQTGAPNGLQTVGAADVSPRENPRVVQRHLAATALQPEPVAIDSLTSARLRLVPATPPSNLPDDATSFIGRAREIADVTALLNEPAVRLVTLTGVGGAGKTRLAIRVGMVVVSEFRDGVVFVPLASLSDPEAIPSAIASAVGVRDDGRESVVDHLVRHFREKHVLLLLDNFEHLTNGAGVVATLLDACRQISILVTSRAPLHLTREHRFEVRPFALPDLNHLPDAKSLSELDAVSLFLARARAVKSDFALTQDVAPAVAQICARLDGLPLAIELAAARTDFYPPHALLERLSRGLDFLVGTARDLPSQHRTLRATIDWSYELLSPEEQRLFALLGVFRGGSALEAIEAVSAASGEATVTALLASLVEKHLVRQVGARELRCEMLETIREYALEMLAVSGTSDAVREAHAQFYLSLAEMADRQPSRSGRQARLDRLQTEYGNIQAAFDWWTGRRNWGNAARLAVAMEWFWGERGPSTEGYAWLSAVLRSQVLDDVTRVRVLVAAAVLAIAMGKVTDATALAEEAAPLYAHLDDPREAGRARFVRGYVAQARGDYSNARVWMTESLLSARESGNAHSTALALHNLALLAVSEGNLETAETILEEEIPLWQAVGHTAALSSAINLLGISVAEREQYARAAELFDKSVSLARSVPARDNLALALIWSGVAAQYGGDLDAAHALYDEASGWTSEWENKREMAFLLACRASLAHLTQDYQEARNLYRGSYALMADMGEKYPDLLEVSVGLAELEATTGDPQQACRLLGVAETLRASLGTRLSPRQQTRRETILVQVESHLDLSSCESALEEGRRTPLANALSASLHRDT